MFLLVQTSTCDVVRDHRICKHPPPNHPTTFLYFISSEQPVYARDFLPDDAASVHVHVRGGALPSCECCVVLPDADAFMQDVAHPACDDDRDDGADHACLMDRSLQQQQLLRQALRDRLWTNFTSSRSISPTTQYLIWLHVIGTAPYTRQQLELFQQLLLQEEPDVGVPFHVCNVRDARSSKAAAVSGVYDPQSFPLPLFPPHFNRSKYIGCKVFHRAGTVWTPSLCTALPSSCCCPWTTTCSPSFAI
jgi:hypothetical protein